jgi:hypothetical protein
MNSNQKNNMKKRKFFSFLASLPLIGGLVSIKGQSAPVRFSHMKIPDVIPTLWYENEEGDRWLPTDEDIMDCCTKRPFTHEIQVSRFPRNLQTGYTKENVGTICAFNSSWNAKLATNMVLAGVPIEEAILRAGVACERCMNALGHAYGVQWGGEDGGYPENSKEYQNSNTRCEFCK